MKAGRGEPPRRRIRECRKFNPPQIISFDRRTTTTRSMQYNLCVSCSRKTCLRALFYDDFNHCQQYPSHFPPLTKQKTRRGSSSLPARLPLSTISPPGRSFVVPYITVYAGETSNKLPRGCLKSACERRQEFSTQDFFPCVFESQADVEYRRHLFV